MDSSNDPPKERTVARLIREALEVEAYRKTRPWLTFRAAEVILKRERMKQQEAAK